MPVIAVMGVAGSGKTTVGAELAARLGVEYADADAFHPPANIAKITAATPTMRNLRSTATIGTS